MVKKVTDSIILKEAQLIFRNFSGKPSQYNDEGKRNTCVFIDDPVLVDQLRADGWSIKLTNKRDDDDVPRAYMRVNINYKGLRPPKIVTVTNRGRVQLSEEEINMLDWADIKYVNMEINPFNWGPIRGEYGVTGYLKAMHVVLEEDRLEALYLDEPDAVIEPAGVSMCGDCKGCDGTGDCSNNDDLPF